MKDEIEAAIYPLLDGPDRIECICAPCLAGPLAEAPAPLLERKLRDGDE